MTATLPPPVHPDRAAMLRQILEWPEDDAPRLVFADWLDEQGDHGRANAIRDGISWQGPRDFLPYRGTQIKCEFEVCHQRGFISAVRLPCSAFMRHARELFESHPITTVRLTDYGPEPSSGDVWILNGPADVVFYDLDDACWSEEEYAAKELNDRLVAYGRELAGLRPLSA